MNTTTIQTFRELRNSVISTLNAIDLILKDLEMDKKTVIATVNKDIAVSPKTEADVRNVFSHIYTEPVLIDSNGKLNTDYCICIFTNQRSHYWKVTQGKDKGAVLKTSSNSLKVTFDGRFRGTQLKKHYSSHLAIVSCDKDGKDYVNRVIRQWYKSQNQDVTIRRMYRPKGHAGKFTHCDIYPA